MNGIDRLNNYKAAGFTDDELGNWTVQKSKELSDAGFGMDEISSYFGKPPFDPKPIQEHVNTTMAAATKPATEGGQPRLVTGFEDALKAGYGESFLGLLGGKPTTTVAQDAPTASRIAGHIGTLAGDIPSMGMGFLAGGGPASPVTGLAGAFAAQQGFRKILMDKYEKGEVTGWPDFWERFSGAFIDSMKGWVTGAATGLAGKAIGMAPIAYGPTKIAAQTAGEIATMLTVGAGLEGKMPEPQDVMDTVLTLGVVKGVAKVAGKVRKIYEQTGVKPEEVAQDVAKDPTILHDLVSDHDTIPNTYQPKAVPSVEDIHAQADARGIKWDNTPAFMDLTEAITGKRHLDELTPAERQTVANAMAEWEPKQAMGGGAPGKPAAQAKPLSEAQKAILDRFMLKDPETPGTTLSDVYTSVVDNLNPIKQALKAGGKDSLETAVNPYSLERLSRGIAGKASQFLNHGAFDFDTYKTVTKGYFQILDPIKNDLNGFRAYMGAKRAIEKEGQGIKTGMPLEEAQTVVREGAKKYEAIHQERIAYRNALVDTLQKSGILSAERVAAMKEANKDYVPFYRYFEDEQGRPITSKSVKNPIKEMTGSERQILDPIISDIKDTFLFVGLAEKNAARQAFVALGPEFAKPVGKPLALPPASGIPEVMNEVRTSTALTKTNELAVYENGKRQVYNVDAKVAEAFNGLDAGPASLLAKIAYTPASLLRAGVTITPDFIARNVMRDAVSSFIYAGSNPLKTAKGLVSIVKEDTAFQNWMKGGGANATMVAIDRDYLSKNLGQLDLETGLMKRAWNIAKTPLDILRAASELAENATRIGAVRKGMMTAETKAQIQALSLIARESTVDFARHGRDTEVYAKSTAFFNPAIQGIDRFAREMKANPLGTTAKAFAAVTLPSMLLWYANRNDEEIQNLPRWQKDLFWISRMPLPNGGSFIMRVPKPQEFGILFGSLPERLLDAYVAENPDALRDIEKTIINAFTPSFVPTAAVPIISQFANRDLFMGRPLIPAGQEGLLPAYQYTPYTTETAKAMGQIIGAFPGMERAAVRSDEPFIGGTARALTSPILIENYVRSWTGGMGYYLLQLADKGLREAGVVPDPVKPASSLADSPFVKSFVVRYPSASAQSIVDFHADYDASKRYWDTMNYLMKEGDPRATELMEAHSEDLVQLSGIKDTLSEQGRLIQMITKNPEFTADDKQQLIDTLYSEMIDISKAGNDFLRALKDVQK